MPRSQVWKVYPGVMEGVWAIKHLASQVSKLHEQLDPSWPLLVSLSVPWRLAMCLTQRVDILGVDMPLPNCNNELEMC